MFWTLDHLFLLLYLDSGDILPVGPFMDIFDMINYQQMAQKRCMQNSVLG